MENGVCVSILKFEAPINHREFYNTVIMVYRSINTLFYTSHSIFVASSSKFRSWIVRVVE